MMFELKQTPEVERVQRQLTASRNMGPGIPLMLPTTRNPWGADKDTHAHT